MHYSSTKTTLNAQNQMWKQKLGEHHYVKRNTNPANFEAVVPLPLLLISAGWWSALRHLCGRRDYTMTLPQLPSAGKIRVQDKTASLGSTGTAAEMVALKLAAIEKDHNFSTKQRSSPGPKIKAPPCWAGSPWKSKTGPVIALHILLKLPRNMFDFTWGLRTRQNGKIFVI